MRLGRTPFEIRGFGSGEERFVREIPRPLERRGRAEIPGSLRDPDVRPAVRSVARGACALTATASTSATRADPMTRAFTSTSACASILGPLRPVVNKRRRHHHRRREKQRSLLRCITPGTSMYTPGVSTQPHRSGRRTSCATRPSRSDPQSSACCWRAPRWRRCRPSRPAPRAETASCGLSGTLHSPDGRSPGPVETVT